jgi:hypothetical protein
MKIISGYGTENGSGPKSGSVPKRIWEKIIPTIYGYQELPVCLNMFSFIVRRRQGSINHFIWQSFPGILKQLGSEEKPGFGLKKKNEIFRALLNCFTFNHRMMEEADESVLLELTEHQRPDPPAAEEPPTIVLDDDNETLLDVDEEMEDDEIKLLERAIGDRPAPTGDDVPAQACPDIPAIAAVAVPPPSPHPATSEKEKVNDYDSESNSTRNSENQSGYMASTCETCESMCYNYSKYGTRSRVGEGEQYIDSEKPQMSSNYFQCRAARGATLSHITYKVNLGPEAGTSEQVSYQRIGSFECKGDTELLKTFRGSRITCNGITVNQNISFTFDPANLKCVVCSNPYEKN